MRAKAKKRALDLTAWLQCFAVYVGVLGPKFPAEVPELMAYMISIVGPARNTRAQPGRHTIQRTDARRLPRAGLVVPNQPFPAATTPINYRLYIVVVLSSFLNSWGIHALRRLPCLVSVPYIRALRRPPCLVSVPYIRALRQRIHIVALRRRRWQSDVEMMRAGRRNAGWMRTQQL